MNIIHISCKPGIFHQNSFSPEYVMKIITHQNVANSLLFSHLSTSSCGVLCIISIFKYIHSRQLDIWACMETHFLALIWHFVCLLEFLDCLLVLLLLLFSFVQPLKPNFARSVFPCFLSVTISFYCPPITKCGSSYSSFSQSSSSSLLPACP